LRRILGGANGSTFPHRAFSDEERALALDRFRRLRPHLEDGLPLARLARAEGIPLRTARRWVRRYREQGLAGLVRRPRSDLFGGDDATGLKEDVGPEAAGDELPPSIVRLPSAGDAPPAAGDPPWRLLEERRLDPNRGAAWGYQRVSAWRVSPTDPDATPMQTRTGAALGYHDHYVVDGGKARVILAALVTPADVMENVPLRDLL
jgi:transposase-like protein